MITRIQFVHPYDHVIKSIVDARFHTVVTLNMDGSVAETIKPNVRCYEAKGHSCYILEAESPNDVSKELNEYLKSIEAYINAEDALCYSMSL